MEGAVTLQQTINLLVRIAEQGEPMKVELNYDGKNFSWRVTQSNLSAEELEAQRWACPNGAKGPKKE